MLSGSAPLSPGADRARSPSAPGSRSTRATASPRPPRSSPAPCAARSSSPARWAPRCPASRSGCVDEAGRRARGRGPRRDPDLRARTSSAATGPTAPAARTTTAGGPPATSASSTPRGDLFLVDRLKDLVIVSGFNVYPVEVEDVIREVDGVTEAAVIGVEDDDTGEAVVAYVGAPGADADDDRGEPYARTASSRLARFKQPSRIEVVDELPLTVTGKVQKGRLRGLERRRTTGLLE